jgi:hypothetical protein
MVVILIETTNLLRFFRTLQLSADKAVLRTVARLNTQAAVGPELSLATKPVRGCVNASKRTARIGPMQGI